MGTKVSIVRCKSYNRDEVKAAVKRCFDLLGGLSLFVKDKDRVLIKPNLLSARPPEDGVNTHVEIIRAVVREVKQCGARPFIGDNPGGGIKPRSAYESSGILSIAKEESVECIEVRAVKIVKGLPLASYFFECDKIISLPKMKTHSLMGLTGGVKNMFGAVSGLNKSECHKRFPKPEEFVNVLVDVFEALRPDLVLMDGVIAMDGNGPSAGRLKNAGVLIASQDSVAVDSIFSHLIGINPGSILTTKEAGRRGLGKIDLGDMEILGDGIHSNIMSDFKMPEPSIYARLPSSIIKLLARFVKFWPYIDEAHCRRCKICSETCPMSAIYIGEDKIAIEYDKCIRCLCCHEVCPSMAIELRRNILARIFGL